MKIKIQLLSRLRDIKYIKRYVFEMLERRQQQQQRLIPLGGERLERQLS